MNRLEGRPARFRVGLRAVVGRAGEPADDSRRRARWISCRTLDWVPSHIRGAASPRGGTVPPGAHLFRRRVSGLPPGRCLVHGHSHRRSAGTAHGRPTGGHNRFSGLLRQAGALGRWPRWGPLAVRVGLHATHGAAARWISCRTSEFVHTRPARCDSARRVDGVSAHTYHTQRASLRRCFVL